MLAALFLLALAQTPSTPPDSTLAAPRKPVPSPAAAKGSVVVLETSMGRIKISLNAAKAPLTVENFIRYVKAGHYDGTIFHRVIPSFMIQAGGFDTDMKERPTRAPIKNESKNGLRNLRGTIAMARTEDPHSATAQFFINLKDNAALDFGVAPGWGYAVFGEVLEGMDVVDKIASVPTTSRGSYQDVPAKPVIITSARVAP